MTIVVWQTMVGCERYDVTAVVSIQNGSGIATDVVAYRTGSTERYRLDPLQIEGISQKSGLAVMRDRLFQRLADEMSRPASHPDS